jgi:hypothetical protein
LAYTNANSFPVIIPGCLGLWVAGLEKRRPDGVWVYAVSLGPYAKCLEETVVPAGATRRKVVALTFPESSFAGEYRVILEVWTAGAKEHFTSNTFTLLASGS